MLAMLKRLFLILVLTAALPAAADPLQDTVTALGQQSAALAQQMRPAGVNLTWGQDIAAQDMNRLAQAAAAVQGLFTDDEEHTYDDLAPLVSELQVAATRVKSSAPISVLDDVQQQQALGLVDKAQLVKVEVDAARRAAEERRAAQRAAYNSSFGFGFGTGWGWPGYYGGGWGPWGYPGYGWGSRFGVGFGFGRPVYYPYAGGRRWCR